MKSVVTRWDPASRAGAVAVRARSPTDVEAIQALAENTQEWAKYLDLTGEKDGVETSPTTFKGTYDWRSYIAEEAEIARRRDERAKPAAKKADRPTPPAAPTVFYA